MIIKLAAAGSPLGLPGRGIDVDQMWNWRGSDVELTWTDHCMWSSGFERGPCRRTSGRKPQTRGVLQFLAPNEGPFCELCRLDGNFELIFGQFIMVWHQSLLSEIHFTLIKATCCTVELAVTCIFFFIVDGTPELTSIIYWAPMNGWVNVLGMSVLRRTHCQSGWRDHSAVMVWAEEPHHLGVASLGGDGIQRWLSELRNHITWMMPVWVERPFSCDGQGRGTTSPGCCQSGWRCHSAVTVRAEEPHHLGAASLGGDAIQRWSSERRYHLTWVLPVWVERPFSCEGQSRGTTSPGCCQSGWRCHSAVTVRAEEPHHLGAASLGGDAIQRWSSERRYHLAWVLPVWVERPFSYEGQSGGTTSPGCCQSGWRRHSAVTVRAEEPHHLDDASLGGETIQLWWSGRRNHITWMLPVWVEVPFSCDGQGGGTTSPGCCQSGWRRHSAMIVWATSPGCCQSGWRDRSAMRVRAEEPHHLGAASLSGDGIQRWLSERRNHITWMMPVWVERPFSCDGQGGGTTSPGCCQSGWRCHSAVTVRAEEPHHLGAASLGGDAIQRWSSERRYHLTWVLPVWVERPFSCEGQSGGTTSPGCCQSGWRRHSAVTVRAEEPHHLAAASLDGETIRRWWPGRRNHHHLDVVRHTGKLRKWNQSYVEFRGNGTSHLGIHGKAGKWNQTFVTWKIRFIVFRPMLLTTCAARASFKSGHWNLNSFIGTLVVGCVRYWRVPVEPSIPRDIGHSRKVGNHEAD